MNAVMKIDHGIARYEAMCTAIAECHRVDEVKDIRDKARALEVYAKQAMNSEAERKATEVRLRAERRTGELLAELARAEGPQQGKAGPGRGNTSNDAACFDTRSEYARALDENGLSRQTAHRYQQLASVPKDQFEAHLDGDEKPSTAGIIRAAPRHAHDPGALWVWGRARDFERDKLFSRTPAELLSHMTDAMRTDMARLAPMLSDFWASFNDEVNQ